MADFTKLNGYTVKDPNAIHTYDTITDLKADTKLKAGDHVKTKGYYSINDGGHGEYAIVDDNSLVDDGGFIHELNNGLFAKLIHNNVIYTKQFGAVGDGVTDDTTKIQAILNLIASDYNDSFTVIVNGYHKVQTGLTLQGTSGSYLTNITIKGEDAMRDYANFNGIKNGFIFDATDHYDIADFNQTKGFYINYTRGLSIKNLKFTTTESVENGELPLNNIECIRVENTQGNELRNCNFTKFYIAFYYYSGGIGYIKNNNFALCNIGLKTRNSGDSTIEDNYFNSMGFNIYNLDGTLKSTYATLHTNNLVFGYALYLGDGGNMTIKGGKIEWVCVGVWQDYSTNNVFDAIQFDRCSVCGIAFTGHNRPNVNTSVVNCNFTGCGGISPTGNGSEVHIGGIGASCIGAANVYGLLISNNHFTADNGRLTGAFRTSGNYFGPTYALYFNGVYQTSFINNIVQIDNQYAYFLLNCEVEYNNNICNKPWYMNTNCIVYRQAGIKREIYHDQPSTITSGNFDFNDMVYSQNNLLSGWRVTVAGSMQTINSSVSVVTTATEFYPGDGSVIDLGASLPSGVRVGTYVNIAGVTGTKKIIGVIQNNNHFYAKLDTPCDVAVQNATMNNATPTFTSI